MFFEDAQLVSRELDLTLTGKDCGEEERAPMCGIPYHACEPYIGKLIAKGYKVAICEQTEDPSKTKTLVKREVIRVITPGTVIESDLLSEDKNNYLATMYRDGGTVGLCFADISTAYICATSVEVDTGEDSVLTEMSTYSPKELVTKARMKDLPRLRAGCHGVRPAARRVPEGQKRRARHGAHGGLFHRGRVSREGKKAIRRRG